jgi:hypothetical protein
MASEGRKMENNRMSGLNKLISLPGRNFC